VKCQHSLVHGAEPWECRWRHRQTVSDYSLVKDLTPKPGRQRPGFLFLPALSGRARKPLLTAPLCHSNEGSVYCKSGCGPSCSRPIRHATKCRLAVRIHRRGIKFPHWRRPARPVRKTISAEGTTPATPAWKEVCRTQPAPGSRQHLAQGHRLRALINRFNVVMLALFPFSRRSA
jgi:hypothetical protein